MNTEKFKLMKYLGNICESFDDIFEIDHITFNYIQHNIAIIQKNFSDAEENYDEIITRNISIKVYLPDLFQKNFENRHYEVGMNENSYDVHIIEYNDFYNIDNKFKVIDVKLIACRYWELYHENYFLCDEKLNIYPCDLVIYDEIFLINLDANFIKPHCQFFHLNPKIIV